MKIHSDNQINIIDNTVALILKSYGISNFSFKPINQGIENTSLFVESEDKRYVLRVYRQKRKNNEDISFEIQFQDYLRENGIPIPLMFPNLQSKELSVVNIDGKDWQIILMQFIEGESVNLNPSDELIIELAHIQARMHLLGIEFTNKSDESKFLIDNLNGSIANKIENLPIHNEDVVEFVERVKSYKYELNKELPYGYNHSDLDFDGNVIIRDNKVAGIIDFDDLRYSPSVMCLGFSLWNILDDSGIEAFKLYLKEYESIRPLNNLEKEALPHVIFFRNYQIGIIRLLLWEKDTPIEDINKVIKLESDIPVILDHIS
jgi:Ser/Thr protein kinase RdoA (MazF antagonist)